MKNEFLVRWIAVVGILIWVLVFICLAVAASAQSGNCADRAVIGAILADRWGEAPVGQGLGANGTLVEVWASPATATWTITVTPPGGPTCLVASGDGYEHLTFALPAPGEEM
jgi:hypothetical protein